MCHQILIDANNNYLQNKFKVNEYIEKHKLEVEDKSLYINACLPSNHEIHSGWLNNPTAPDVAVLVQNSMQYMNSKRRLILDFRKFGNCLNDLKTTIDIHQSYDLLQYPLIFLQATDGWYFNNGHHAGVVPTCKSALIWCHPAS